MLDLLQAFFHPRGHWEWLAVGLSVAYLLLAMRESLWCWPAAFVSTAIYTWLFWQVNLLMDSLLNVYYMLMAAYGLASWSAMSAGRSPSASASKDAAHPAHTIIRWSRRGHVQTLILVGFVSVLSGYVLQRHSEAAWPYLDSFTTWASVATTYMVVKKVLENWLYWIVINAVAIALYIERGLYPTAVLFGLYLLLAIVGYRHWHSAYRYRHRSHDNQGSYSR